MSKIWEPKSASRSVSNAPSRNGSAAPSRNGSAAPSRNGSPARAGPSKAGPSKAAIPGQIVDKGPRFTETAFETWMVSDLDIDKACDVLRDTMHRIKKACGEVDAKSGDERAQVEKDLRRGKELVGRGGSSLGAWAHFMVQGAIVPKKLAGFEGFEAFAKLLEKE